MRIATDTQISSDTFLRHVEGLEVFVASTLPCVDQVGDAFLLQLILVDAAVLSQELLDGPVATADPDHNRLALDLHEHLLPGEPVDAGGLPLELHLAAQAERRFVDVVCEVAVDRVVLQRLVDEEFVLNRALHVFHLLLQPFNLLILRLAPTKKLQPNRLGLLQALLDLEQARRALMELIVQVSLEIVALAQGSLKCANARLLVLLSA